MTTVRWLKPDDPPEVMPDPSQALDDPNGLLAAGGSLAPNWLLHSYRNGVFPWYEDGQPILWWSPDPRAVLVPEDLKISRSLARLLRRNSMAVTCDTEFKRVVAACAEPRRYSDKTWITDDMATAYSALHRLGFAHSFEVWSGDLLVGGLYGVAIGQVFCGESMFSREANASKLALVHCARFLSAAGFRLIDCQLPSAHLESLGAITIGRQAFLDRLRLLAPDGPQPGPWTDAFATRHTANSASS